MVYRKTCLKNDSYENWTKILVLAYRNRNLKGRELEKENNKRSLGVTGGGMGSRGDGIRGMN